MLKVFETKQGLNAQIVGEYASCFLSRLLFTVHFFLEILTSRKKKWYGITWGEQNIDP